MKRTPMNRGKGLERKKPIEQKKPTLSIAKAMKKESRAQARDRVRRDTGPTRETRGLVFDRSGGNCERCGKMLIHDHHAFKAFSIHHRRPRGMGGSRDEKTNQASNLVLLCGSATTPEGCHATVERFRASAVTTGYIVPQGTDPETVPIKLVSGWYILRPDGLKVPTVRPEILEEE